MVRDLHEVTLWLFGPDLSRSSLGWSTFTSALILKVLGLRWKTNFYLPGINQDGKENHWIYQGYLFAIAILCVDLWQNGIIKFPLDLLPDHYLIAIMPHIYQIHIPWNWPWAGFVLSLPKGNFSVWKYPIRKREHIWSVSDEKLRRPSDAGSYFGMLC